MFSRKKSLNTLTASKISDFLPVLFAISFIIPAVLPFVGAIEIAGLFQFINFVIWIVIAFKMKNILKEFSDKNEMSISYNGFLTFLFNTCYINYKLNENIDYIAQNNIVDKEETTASDKETTSEKTPESPEDRLQKLGDMKEKGLINEDEFNSKKEDILKEM